MGTLIIKPEEQARIDERAKKHEINLFSFSGEFVHPVLTLKQQAQIENLMNFIHRVDATLAKSADDRTEVIIFVDKYEEDNYKGLVDVYRKTLKDKRTFNRAVKAMEEIAAFYLEKDKQIFAGCEAAWEKFFRWNGTRKVRFINLYLKNVI